MTKQTVDRRTFMTQASAAGVAGVVLTHSAAQASRLARTTSETFSPFLGKEFLIEDEEGNATRVTLTSVENLKAQPESTRQPFVLSFRGPTGVEIGQDTYVVRHPKLGRLHLLLTPVDHRANHNQLEAIFA